MDNPATPRILHFMKHDSDVVIVGGGLNGPALALALAQGGLSVTIVDALPLDTRKDDTFDGRSYALALASQKLLSALGIWNEIADHAQPILKVAASDGHAGEGPAPFFLEFDHAEIEEGPMGFMIEDRYLRRAFLDAVMAEDRVAHLSGETVVAQDVQPGGVTVTLQSGKTVSARVLIGCDGKRSGTAERAGISRTGWEYGQTALVCAIEHEKPHEGTAHQFFMPAGPLAILPLPGNRSSIVWSETTDQAAAIQAMDDDSYLAALRPRFGDFLGEIKLAGARFTYPLSLSLANAFVSDRLALVGDAAHGVHPIAGQGLNLGLRDVAALAEVMVDAHRRGEEIGAIDVLERYQTWRRWDTATLAAATDGFNRLFSNDNPLLRGVRDIGMGVVNAMPGLRRRFIREAAGLNGELPRLMKGRPI
ncbi:FAD-dependent monooxygenase [Actibacterium lipolyticum]|uniref:2-octaprenylphenol hydroxylase n=1 Tax=Actibacterium lipolyticum TaxID=1524263 RepID=A0A238KVW4_9RHOB|nr:FAD-dependent monooxygenase [Actibacterium lipolyticum]SMX46322.1 2-octaprenylphenol hydroxylase [Actibacterium lipolyticum]